MVINTMMIGKIKAVRRIEVTEKIGDEWKNDIPKIEITIESEAFDDNGDINFSMDKQILDATEYPLYKSLENKFVAVPYVLKNDSRKDWRFDKSMPIVELKDSFTNLVKTDSKTATKA